MAGRRYLKLMLWCSVGLLVRVQGLLLGIWDFVF
jgi:hypothetical protein